MGKSLMVIAAIAIATMVYVLLSSALEYLFVGRVRTQQRIDETEHLDKMQNEIDKPDDNAMNQIVHLATFRILNFFEFFMGDTKTNEEIEKQLKKAGIRMSPKRYRAIVMYRMVFGGLFVYAVEKLTGATPEDIAMYTFLGFAGGYVLSRFTLGSKITKRNDEIYHQLPNVIDILAVSVAAGLGFDQALAYVCQKTEGAFVEELDLTRREVALGKPRTEALQDLSKRLENQEINSFVTAVIQADATGSSLKNVLQIQAETIRETHKQKVEEAAYKLSIKMLIPMVLFIFPVIFIVLLGPAMITMMDAFAGMQ